MKGYLSGLTAVPARMEAAAARIVEVSAQRCAGEARSFAPVDSGELRSGIAAVRAGRLEAAAVSAAPHAAMVEYGTCRMPPRPYMLPAAQAARDEFFKSARAAVREVLK